MARLRVFKLNNLVKDLTLIEGSEYLVGRAAECDLVLDAERGISRQHLKISNQEGTWTVEVVSRYGELYHKSNKVQKIKLTSVDHFEIPPYEFHFEGDEEPVVAPASTVEEALEVGSPDMSDKTFVGGLSVSPFLTVSGKGGKISQVFRLDGQNWIVGRDPGCTVQIDNPKFSRRHFEIFVHEGAYLIKDLGSSNGTVLNDQLLMDPAGTVIRSGDTVKVADWNLRFELRDTNYESRLQEVPDQIRQPGLMDQPMIYDQPPASEQMEPEKKKLNVVRILIGLCLIGGVGFYFMDDGKKKETTPGTKVNTLNALEKLSPQQQQYVKDTYRLADRLFKEGRYEMARQEIAKIHELVPSFEESKNLEKLADIAIQTQVEQQKADAREKDRLEMEEKIQKTLAECRTKVNGSVEMREIDDCLMPIMALSPDHQGIVALKSEVDHIISTRTVRNVQRAEYQSLVKKHKALFDKATSVANAGDALEALKAFQIVINSKLPDPEDLKGQAQKQIASIQKKLVGQQAQLEQDADAAYKKGDIKTAVQTLQKALLINPENETLKGRVNSMLGEIKKQMQNYYQEGILEESVGEVETAKNKWKKIIELSLPEEDYYKKAKAKLKKYGVE